MKGYQQLSLNVNGVNRAGKYIPKIQISMVKEVCVSKTSFSCSQAIAESEIVEKELKHSDREKFIYLHLKVKNKIISYEIVSVGSLSSSIVYPREVFKAAILSNADSVVFLHNHLSGSTEPSLDDIEITKRLSKSGSILGIRVLDYIIIAGENWLSFREKGLI